MMMILNLPFINFTVAGLFLENPNAVLAKPNPLRSVILAKR
jgi:hypothetical protein